MFKASQNATQVVYETPIPFVTDADLPLQMSMPGNSVFAECTIVCFAATRSSLRDLPKNWEQKMVRKESHTLLHVGLSSIGADSSRLTSRRTQRLTVQPLLRRPALYTHLHGDTSFASDGWTTVQDTVMFVVCLTTFRLP